MDAQQFLNDYQGQSLLYAPSPAREYLRGQCAQAACVYVAANDFPVIWVEAAADWYLSGLYPDRYDRFENTSAAVPQPGDIIVWDKALPGSGGYGHIAIFLHGDVNSFVSIDQNWNGKTVHTVNHTYAHVLGWLRMKRAVPAPIPAPQPQGDEMITNEAQAHQAYKLLRPNGDGSSDEIAMTAGKRSWASFADGAQNEISQRDANLRDQQQQLASSQGTVTQLQQQIAQIQQQGQQVTAEQLAQLQQLTTQLSTAHSQIADLQAKLNPTIPMPSVPTQSVFSLIASLLRIKPKV